VTAHRQGGRAERPVRVAKQLREEISQLMLTEMKDPRVRLASVTQVVAASDLRSARVRVSAIGTDAEREAVVVALRHAEGFMRGVLGGRLENLKVVPHLHFELDESIAYSVRVHTALRELEAGRPERAAAAMEDTP
jgi:ribosome-binding factor A